MNLVPISYSKLNLSDKKQRKKREKDKTPFSSLFVYLFFLTRNWNSCLIKSIFKTSCRQNYFDITLMWCSQSMLDFWMVKQQEQNVGLLFGIAAKRKSEKEQQQQFCPVVVKSGMEEGKKKDKKKKKTDSNWVCVGWMLLLLLPIQDKLSW